MPNKLFVGNLSFNAADSELNELFASLSIPVVSINVMRDTDTGRSRGFAFAELAPEADMDSAIKQLNGKVLDGRPLTVNEARPQRPREGGGRGSFGRNQGRRFSGSRSRGNGGHPPKRDRGPSLY
jgi:RNA recognition motif-containing protein